MKRLLRNHHQSGFTIVELLLALTFFSFILLFATAGFIQINRSYNKGLTVKQMNETGRLVLEDITRAIRATPSGDVQILPAVDAPNVAIRRLCAGSTRFGWNEVRDTGTNRERMLLNGALYRQLSLSRTIQPGNCTDPFDEPYTESYLASPNLGDDTNSIYGGIEVFDLNFERIGNAIRIELVLVSTDPGDELLDLTDPDNVTCRGSLLVGGEFCDTVRLSTTVSLRT